MIEKPFEAESNPATAPDGIDNVPNPRVMAPLHWIAGRIFHAQTTFEDGAVEALHDHRDNGGSTLVLMSHFSRLEPLIIAQVAETEEPLRYLRCKTGITAREELFHLQWPLGAIVRNSGAQVVQRSVEHPGETPDEAAMRRENNQKTQTAGADYLRNGLHWLIYPEGGSKKYDIKDGARVSEPRKGDELLPLQRGFVYTIEALSEQERENVMMLGMVAHFGDRFLSGLRPSLYVTRPESPVKGATGDELLQQGTDMMQKGLENVLRIDAAR